MTGLAGFWWKPGHSLPALALWPVSAIWGLRSTKRMQREPAFRAPVPVLCIGNFVVGGAGKTPTALAVADIARRMGHKPGFLAPGYGGSEIGPLMVDTARHGASDVGDEPLLLAAAAPTAIGRDRAASARLLIDRGIDLIVMDDGFQNPTLAKDLNLICVDGGAGIGNGMVIPSGPLRAPLPFQLERAHALIVIGDDTRAKPVIDSAKQAGMPVLRAALQPVESAEWQDAPVLAFAGIGRPEKFYQSLREAGVEVAETRSFADHHRFTEDEALSLLDQADRQGLQLVTTEKDRVRLAGEPGDRGRLYQHARAFGVTLRFEDERELERLVGSVVGL